MGDPWSAILNMMIRVIFEWMKFIQRLAECRQIAMWISKTYQAEGTVKQKP